MKLGVMNIDIYIPPDNKTDIDKISDDRESVTFREFMKSVFAYMIENDLLDTGIIDYKTTGEKNEQ